MDNLTPSQPEETKAQILSVLKDLFNGSERDQIVSLLTDRKLKPTSWDGKANAPYYREKYALELKCVVDAMLKEAESHQYDDRVWFYNDFSELSHNSLYLKIYQSKLYLLERLDFDKKYQSFFQKVRISRERGIGIRVSWDKSIVSPVNEDFTPKKIIELSWREAIDEFLESANPGDKFKLDSIALSPEDIVEVTASLSQLKDILFKVTEGEILIIKLTDEQMAKFK